MSQTNATVRPGRMGLIAALLAATLIIAGFREKQPKQEMAGNPAASVKQRGGQPNAAGTPTEPSAAVEPFSLAYVPRDALAVVACRPAAIMNLPALAVIKATLGQVGDASLFGLSVDRFEHVTAVFLLDAPDSEPSERFGGQLLNGATAIPWPVLAGLIIRVADANDVETILSAMQPDRVDKEYAGRIYRAGKEGRDWNCFLASDKVVVASEKEEHLRRLIVAGKNGAASTKWGAAWQPAGGADAALLVNTGWLADLMNGTVVKAVMDDPITKARLSTLAPLWQVGTTWVLSADCGSLAVRLRITTASADDAANVHEALAAAIALGQNALTYARQTCSQDRGASGALGLILVDLVDALCDSVAIEQRDQVVMASANISNVEPLRIVIGSRPAAKMQRDEEHDVPATVSVGEPVRTADELPAPTRADAPPGTNDAEPDNLPAPVLEPAVSTVTDGGSSSKPSNQALANSVAKALIKAKLSGFEIEITVREGVATLDGIVGSEEQRERAVRSTEAVKGISNVVNRLAVNETATEKPVNRVSNDIVQTLSEELATPPLMKWEYKLLRVDEQRTDDLDAKLNELGGQGWELIAVRGASNGAKSSLYFKRQNVQELRQAE